MSKMHPGTGFAPAERSSQEEVALHREAFRTSPLMTRLVNAVPEIVMVLNADRQIVFANKALLEAVGLPDDQCACGLRPGEVLQCVHAYEGAGGCGTTEFCSTCGAVRTILSSLGGKEAFSECRIRLRSGESLDLMVWATPVTIGTEAFSVFAVRDISSQKRRQALERIFFHDVLNTAGGVHGFAYLISRAEPEELEELKSQIYALSGRLIEEINSQREITIAENGELPMVCTQMRALETMAEVRELYRHHEVAHEKLITVDAADSETGFSSDRTLVRRVLGNMVKNALEACGAGETVGISCRAEADMITFRVHSPHFMPREVQLQVFQRSYSTKGVGRGLGTYSMKLLGENYLKGKVWFTTSTDAGTAFHLKIPLEHPSAEED